MSEIEARAEQMTGAQKEAYLLNHGWQWTGMGYIAPGAVESTSAGGAVFNLRRESGGLFSRTTAVLEQLARENPEAYPEPDENGRYYRPKE
jgi:hypothetical protein